MLTDHNTARAMLYTAVELLRLFILKITLSVVALAKMKDKVPEAKQSNAADNSSLSCMNTFEFTGLITQQHYTKINEESGILKVGYSAFTNKRQWQ